MSELSEAFGRLQWRYERAKKHSKTEIARKQIDNDLELLRNSYVRYEHLLTALFEVANGEDSGEYYLPVQLLVIRGYYEAWKAYGLSNVDAIDAALTEGCPHNYFLQIGK